ncbi:MAG: hypothetical protein NTZ14_09020 [Hyphomicrobiales bacterium]|nr:hypothetical protein [Hyphomicrobiales bacterium]
MFKGLSLLAASEFGGSVARNLRAMPYFALAALIFLFGFGFLLDVVHTGLSLKLGSMAASGILAAGLLTAAGVALLVGHAIRHRGSAAPGALTTSALLAAPFAARFLGSRLRLGTVALAGVVALGAVLGRSLGRS